MPVTASISKTYYTLNSAIPWVLIFALWIGTRPYYGIIHDAPTRDTIAEACRREPALDYLVLMSPIGAAYFARWRSPVPLFLRPGSWTATPTRLSHAMSTSSIFIAAATCAADPSGPYP